MCECLMMIEAAHISDDNSPLQPDTRAHAPWKCDMLLAMAMDPAMNLVDVAVAVVVIQHSNKDSKISVITDARLSEILRRGRKTFSDFRRRGAAAGYFDFTPGSWGHATVYRWKNDRLYQIENQVLDRRIKEREQDASAQEAEHSESP
jgi:hypothetical protein